MYIHDKRPNAELTTAQLIMSFSTFHSFVWRRLHAHAFHCTTWKTNHVRPERVGATLAVWEAAVYAT